MSCCCCCNTNNCCKRAAACNDGSTGYDFITAVRTGNNIVLELSQVRKKNTFTMTKETAVKWAEHIIRISY